MYHITDLLIYSEICTTVLTDYQVILATFTSLVGPQQWPRPLISQWICLYKANTTLIFLIQSPLVTTSHIVLHTEHT